MADHNVTLTYGPNGDFMADPQSIQVTTGQSIAFQLGAGSQDGKIRVTFHDKHFFSGMNQHFAQTGVFNDGDGVVTVAQKPPSRTTYHCELVDGQGNVKAHSHENAGGEIMPSS